MKDEDKLNDAKDFNQRAPSLDQYMLEQAEVNDYNQLIKVINSQLYNLLNPVATYYSEYDPETKTQQLKGIKAEPGLVDIALKIGGNDLFSIITPVNDEMYGKLLSDSMAVYSTLTDAIGGGIPENVSESLGEELNINSYLRLAYLIDGQLFGSSVIAFKEIPDHLVMSLLKTYAYFTSMSLKRTLAEQALKQSEQELRTITDNMTELIAMTDAEGRFTFLKGNYFELLGYVKEELLGKSVLEVVCPEDFDRITDLFNKHIAAGESGRAEYRLVRKDGTLIWVETIGSIIYENGQVNGALFVTREIIDRKEAEEALRNSEQELRAITDNMTDVVAMADIEGRFTYLSKSNYQLTGFKPVELLGKSIFELIHAEDLPIAVAAFQEGIAEGRKDSRVEYRVRHKNNEYIWVETIGGLVVDDSGKTSGAIFLSRDISDRVEVEQKLKESEETVRGVIESAPYSIQILDPEGYTVKVNEAFIKLFGSTPPNDYTVLDDPHFDTSIAHKKKINLLKKGERVHFPEIFYNTRRLSPHLPDKPLWIRADGFPLLDINSKVKYLVIIHENITDRKNAEEALRLSEEKYRQIAENISDVVWTTDAELNTLYVSPSVEKMIGESADCHINRSLEERFPPESLSILLNAFQEELEKEKDPLVDKNRSRLVEVQHYKADRSIIWVSMHILFTRDSGGKITGLQGVTRDITDRKKAEEQIRYIGYHDQLTELYNRHYFEDFKEGLEDIPLLSVIMTDINGLKLINDTYGHQAGDELLKKYAELLRKSFKQSDLIFRWGGDEFIVILKNIKEAKSWELCNRLIKHCGETFVKNIPLSISVGISSVKNIPLSISVGISSKLQGGDIAKAIREAEDMMYKNKLNESKSSKNLIMKTLLQTLSEKSFETKSHIDRMTTVSRQFGERLGLSPSELSRLETLSMLHDVGKINIDRRILLKETALTEEDWEEIKKHPEVGYRITRTTEEFAYIAEDILAHHERWDGKGYPQGLERENIPYLARLLSIIDSYDVMSNGRPYKKKMTLEEIIEEVEKCSGKQFDPHLAEKFVYFLKEGAIT